jgi:hypothetical protein
MDLLCFIFIMMPNWLFIDFPGLLFGSHLAPETVRRA